MANRRTLLATLASSGLALIAGCLRNTPESTNGDGGDNGPESDPETVEHQIELLDVQDVPEDVPLEFNIEFLETTLSDQRIPLFEFKVRNVEDQEHIFWVNGGRRPAVPPLSSGLMVLTENERNTVIDEWIEGDGIGGEHPSPDVDTRPCVAVLMIEREDAPTPHRFEAEEERVEKYGLTGTSAGCPESGEYEFSGTYTLGDHFEDRADLVFEWGFTLELVHHD